MRNCWRVKSSLTLKAFAASAMSTVALSPSAEARIAPMPCPLCRRKFNRCVGLPFLAALQRVPGRQTGAPPHRPAPAPAFRPAGARCLTELEITRQTLNYRAPGAGALRRSTLLKFTAVFAVLIAAPLFGQYAGPAILSRGESPSGMSAPQIDFRPFVGLSGVYDNGLAGVGLDSQGQLGNSATYGLQLTAGISGVHSWKHTKLGLDYQGSMTRYAKTTQFDASNHSLMLGVTHQLSKHIQLSLRESAGMFARSYGLSGLPQSVPFDPSLAYIPTTDYFDNRTIYLSSQADLTIQRSARLSFNLGGDQFLNRRKSSSLYGVTGAGARGDISYRVSSHSTIGVAYNYSRYSFNGVFSGTDNHSFSGTYASRLTRTIEFTLMAGALRSETKFVQTVPVDPAIAILIGRIASGVIVHSIDYMPNISARLSRTFSRGVAYFSGGRSVTPGNGLFLTSSATTLGAGYSYNGIRRWSINSNLGYNRSRSLGNVIGEYSSTSGTISASRTLGRSLNLVGSVSARSYGSNDFSAYKRLIYTAQIGLGFTPGDIPMRLW